MSWNIGAPVKGVCGSVMFGVSPRSKSGGNGMSLSGADGCVGAVGYTFGVVAHTLQIGAATRFGCARARKKNPRISDGISFNESVMSVSLTDSSGDGDSLGASGVFCFGNNFSIVFDINFGTGNATIGFCVLMTILVVAMYNGIAASVNKLNTNPPNP